MGHEHRGAATRGAILAGATAAGLLALLAFGTAFQKPPAEEQFTPVRCMLPQAPVSVSVVKPVAEVGEALNPAELVLGVVLDGAARAYPLNMLNAEPARKVVNDTLAGQPIAASFCDNCHNAIVYARDIDDRTLTLAVEGRLWKESMVLYDVETHTFWSHLQGRAKLGRLQGRELRQIPAVLTDWASWRARFPDGTVAWFAAAGQEFTRDYYADPDRFVLGIAAGDKAKAWGLGNLRQSPAQNDTWEGRPVVAVLEPVSGTARLYERTVDGRALTFHMDGPRLSDRETGSIWDAVTGRATAGELAGRSLQPLPAVVSFRKVWRAFHPRSG